MVGYRLRYHSAALPDVAGLPRNIQERLRHAISERLAGEPLRFGEPLAQALAGLRKLRVGDYRVVYEVTGAEVRIWGIDHRRKGYPRMTARRRRPFRAAHG